MKVIKVSAAIATFFISMTAQAKPNILLIIADDMGLDASRCYNVGSQQARMPVLEAMCAEGRVFENAYAAPTCSPTRASIMTGKHGFRSGIGGVISKKGDSQGLSSDEYSLFDALSQSNYQTALIGKWHLAGGNDGFDHPATLGVKEYFGLYTGGTKDYSSWNAVHNGKQVKVENYATTEFTDRAIDWIGDQKSPWFLWLAYNAPHAPFHLPPQNLHSAGELPDDASSIKQNPVPYYNAMLEALDTEMGRLLSSMSEEVRNNTVVMFLGDNGSPTSISKNIYGQRRNKGSIYQGGTNVPFVVTGPNVKAGRTDALMNSSDLYSTIASIAGVSNATSTAIDSFDFSPELTGGKNPNERQFAYSEHFGSKKRKPDVFGWAIRDDRYKLVAEEGEAQEFYDLEKDPLEKTNLLAGSLSQDLTQRVQFIQQTYEDLRNRK